MNSLLLIYPYKGEALTQFFLVKIALFSLHRGGGHRLCSLSSNSHDWRFATYELELKSGFNRTSDPKNQK